jgi:hypothetical protein
MTNDRLNGTAAEAVNSIKIGIVSTWKLAMDSILKLPPFY